MSFKFNPITGNLDLVNDDLPDLGAKFKMHMNSLAAYDRVQSINYANLGTRSQVIQNATMTSSQFPDSNISIEVFYAGVNTMNQRITKFEISGAVLLPDKIRKNYQYTTINGKYIFTGYSYELF